jgi:RNA polymerase sigma-70 factor (ECF subfamily)
MAELNTTPNVPLAIESDHSLKNPNYIYDKKQLLYVGNCIRKALRTYHYPGDFEEAQLELVSKIATNYTHDPSFGVVAAWVYRIVKNYIIDKHRSGEAQCRNGKVKYTPFMLKEKAEKNGGCIEGLSFADMNVLNSTHSFEQENIYDNQLRKKAITDAISKLSAKLGAIYHARYVLGLNYEEIATHLDIPLGTVKCQMNRVHDKLSKLLRESQILKELECVPRIDATKPAKRKRLHIKKNNF